MEEAIDRIDKGISKEKYDRGSNLASLYKSQYYLSYDVMNNISETVKEITLSKETLNELIEYMKETFEVEFSEEQMTNFCKMHPVVLHVINSFGLDTEWRGSYISSV